MDRLTKSVHFIPVKTDFSMQKLAKLYIFEIVRLYGFPVLIIFDRDPNFTSRFWQKLHKALGSRLDFVLLFIRKQMIKLSERRVLGLELVSDTEDKVRLIQDRLKVTSDRQKSYADLKRKNIKYSVGDLVFLKVSPWKKRVRSIAYQLELPSELDRIHDVFHVSMWRCYRSNPTHVVPVEEIEVRPDLTFEEKPIQILDCKTKVLRRKSIPLVKVL
ncbi:uncharacterized protein LOC108481229 [Gossypium arboreum]|uniref:uncharacterized protein LOC108481229 n=1 Tax=Gossypium arboreum TaxID=29729 RepID=UPI0022F1B0FB|nr:uncharacterized protein LOC108481229 [Gossypium arboreum]